MAGRRRSKVVLEDVDGLLSSSGEETGDGNNTARQRTLSISHSGRFKEQKRRGVLSDSVFSKPRDGQRDDGKKTSSTADDYDGKGDDAGRVDANTKYPAPKEQGVSEKMTVVFETKL